MKLVKFGPNWRHWCPACNTVHEIAVDEPFSNGAKWSFDGNELFPTFNPSINKRWGRYADPSCRVKGGVCHYYLHKGVIQYLSDCTHGMAGQSMDLPHLPDRATVR